MRKKNFTIIALGTNLGDKCDNLKQGIAFLSNIIDIKNCSGIYESEALLPENALKSWDSNFYNCVIWGNTDYNVSDLLNFCNEVESKVAGKNRNKGSWEPRYLDIDIIAYNNEIIKNDYLTIPHEKMLERNFVILPLADILPSWQHPVTHEKIEYYKNQISKSSVPKIKKLKLKL